jgi:acyl-CoA reductase-like NAD-dependent aldehyde dehydrogenase
MDSDGDGETELIEKHQMQAQVREKENISKRRTSQKGEHLKKENISKRRTSQKGEHLKKENIMAYQSINPFNGEVLQRFDQHTDAQMESALAKADNIFQNIWSKQRSPTVPRSWAGPLP